MISHALTAALWMEPWSQLTIRGCGRTFSEKAPGLNRTISVLRIYVLTAISYLITTLSQTAKTGINVVSIIQNSFCTASFGRWNVVSGMAL